MKPSAKRAPCTETSRTATSRTTMVSLSNDHRVTLAEASPNSAKGISSPFGAPIVTPRTVAFGGKKRTSISSMVTGNDGERIRHGPGYAQRNATDNRLTNKHYREQQNDRSPKHPAPAAAQKAATPATQTWTFRWRCSGSGLGLRRSLGRAAYSCQHADTPEQRPQRYEQRQCH